MAESPHEDAFEALVRAFAGRPGVTPPEPGNRFGASGLKVNGKIFAMRWHDSLVLKLPRRRVEALIASGRGGPFDAGKGRPMKEWLSVRPSDGGLWLELAAEALEFVGGGRRT